MRVTYAALAQISNEYNGTIYHYAVLGIALAPLEPVASIIACAISSSPEMMMSAPRPARCSASASECERARMRMPGLS